MTTAPTPLPRRHFIGRMVAGLAAGAWLGRVTRAEAAVQVDTTYIGEIRLFAGNVPPNGWAFCQGQSILISDKDALFQLIGTTYGGDGATTFALPDLRSRVPVHVGAGYILGQTSGVESVTLTASQIPAHTHAAGAGSALGTSDSPAGGVPARNAAGVPHYGAVTDTPLAPEALLAAGGSASHPNLQPYLGINYMISLTGVFPSQT